MSGAFSVQITPGSTTIIPLPPPNNVGNVKFAAVYLSLATDFQDGVVRLAIGAPGMFRVENNLLVPVGRLISRQLQSSDQVASVIQLSGGPMAALVEYQ